MSVGKEGERRFIKGIGEERRETCFALCNRVFIAFGCVRMGRGCRCIL